MSRDRTFSRTVYRMVHSQTQLQWRPAVDVYRTRKGWLLKFDLAGVKPEDVTVELRGCVVTVRGRRRDLMLDEISCCYLMEISYDSFERVVDLPCDVSQAQFEMEFRDGILFVRVRTENA